MACLLNAAKIHFIFKHIFTNGEERMKDNELTHTFNKIRHGLGNMWMSKIIYNHGDVILNRSNNSMFLCL